MFVKARVLVRDNAFQPSKMLVSKDRADPSKALFRCSTLGWVPGLTHKH